MGRKINGIVNGVVFKDVTFVNIPDQPECPLEGTILEGDCQNEYHNVKLRDDQPCPHSCECSEKLAKLTE